MRYFYLTFRCENYLNAHDVVQQILTRRDRECCCLFLHVVHLTACLPSAKVGRYLCLHL